jgi:adenylate kinase family enzyme
MTSAASRSPRIVVVGPCASGKTTLARGLRGLGFDAEVCGQEHSDISSLWRHTAPDVVIALAVDLATIRARRGDDWPEWLYRLQNDRLRDARRAARIQLDTSRLDAAATLAAAAAELRAVADPA